MSGIPKCDVGMCDQWCEGYTRKKCYACGNTACAECSRVVKWLRGKRHRICNDCLEDYGMKTASDLRVERERREHERRNPV